MQLIKSDHHMPSSVFQARCEARDNNTSLNDAEYRSGLHSQMSSPQFIAIGAHYDCNAKCIFCPGGVFPSFSLDIFKSFLEEKLKDVFAKANFVGFCGMGELLLIPEIEEFLDYISFNMFGTTKMIVTNGSPLNRRLCDKIIEACSSTTSDKGISYALVISLHAFDASIHKNITGTHKYLDILSNIKYLCDQKNRLNLNMSLRLAFVITTLNIEHLPDFVRTAAKLGFDGVDCSYLNIYEPRQIQLSCYFEKDKTIEAFKMAEDIALEHDFDLKLPPSFNIPETIQEGNCCSDPWKYFYAETQGTVNSCCFANDHMGDLNNDSFEDIWNGKLYQELRNQLSGKLVAHEFCKYCMKNDMRNVNDIRAHISQRKEIRKNIIEYLWGHRHEYKLSEKNLEL